MEIYYDFLSVANVEVRGVVSSSSARFVPVVAVGATGLCNAFLATKDRKCEVENDIGN
jgi:hypothetical protein